MHQTSRIRKGELHRQRGGDPPLILIVDDHVDSAAMAADILAFAGCWTIVADSVDAALEEVRREPPAVIVTDIQMPFRPGVDLIEALRDNPDTQGIPIVACTARSDVFGAWLEDHRLRTIAKPYAPRELVDTIGAVLAERENGNGDAPDGYI